MKLTSKNLLLFSFVFLFVIAGLICVIIFNTPDPQSDVIITHERPASFDSVKSTQFNDAPREVATPAPTTIETSSDIDAAAATPVPEGQWALTVQDPLGDPIPSGIIAFGSESLSFTSSGIIVPATWPHELNIRTSAEGYAPGEFTVTPNSPPLVLDYLCDFLIRVENEKGAPAPNTTIRVWKSNPPPRPVKDQATVYQRTGNSYRLMRNEYECKVTWVSEPRHSYEAAGSSRGDVYPKMGDLVVALGACAWQAGYAPLHHRERLSFLGEMLPTTIQRSRRLRIWDTLCLAERTVLNQPDSSGFKQRLEILRENQLQFYRQDFPKRSENQPPLYEKKTNDKGECRLRGVPPALYYVQAIGGENQYSEIMTLNPACGGALLRLRGESIRLFVYVEKEGIPSKDKLFARVPNAEISLQSQKSIQLYSDKTDGVGEAYFDKLPYGKYRLIVNAQEQTVEKNITIKQAVDSCLVTLPHDEFYSITGIVLEEESGAPVSGYALELNTDNRAGSFGYHIYQETVSDADGCFEFHDVIPGDYCLSEDINSLGELEYIFSDPSEKYCDLTESNTHLSNIKLYVYEDIHDKKVLVKPIVKTNFSGIVVDQMDIPMANAVFTVAARLKSVVYTDKMKLHPKDFKTDSSGLFSLTIFNDWRSENQVYNFEITAMIGDMALPRWAPSIDNSVPSVFVKEKFHASSIASVTLEGDMGDAFNDLRIVLKPQITDKTLQGKLVAEGEDQFSLVYITATQNNQDVFIQLNKDGYFKAENISTGDMALDINTCICTSVDTTNGPREYNKYLNRIVKIRIEDEQPETYVEIPLHRAGYYWGYVKDGEGNPLPGTNVWAEDKPNPNGHRVYPSDENGFFFISSLNLVEGKNYNIKYRIEGKLKVIPNVPLNTGNLMLQ